MLKGVSAARRNRVKPPALTTCRSLTSPACAPRPSPTSCASDADDEIITSYEAVEYGVSTTEIRRRDFERQRCSMQLPHGWMPGEDRKRVCATAIMWGLSESVFTRREKEAEEKCKYSDEEKAKLELPWRKMRDHPVKQKHEACMRNIMLGR